MKPKKQVEFDVAISKIINFRSKHYLNAMLKNFDIEILRTNPLLWQDIWIYNYIKYEITTKIKSSGLIKRYEKEVFIFEEKEFKKHLRAQKKEKNKTEKQNDSKPKQTSVKTFQASFVIGLCKGYSKTVISTSEFKTLLREGQKKVKEKFKFNLSTKLVECTIFLEGQDENSIELNFIQYPIFTQKEDALKKSILFLAEFLMNELEQNRTVVVFPKESIMLEIDSSKIDNGISK